MGVPLPVPLPLGPEGLGLNGEVMIRGTPTAGDSLRGDVIVAMMFKLGVGNYIIQGIRRVYFVSGMEGPWCYCMQGQNDNRKYQVVNTK